jgi:hypothetical protein
MPHTMAVPPARTAGPAGPDGCRHVEPHGRTDCVRDMDRRIAAAIRRDGISRGTALAIYGEAVETHPGDPCSAREQLTVALGELVLA